MSGPSSASGAKGKRKLTEADKLKTGTDNMGDKHPLNFTGGGRTPKPVKYTGMVPSDTRAPYTPQNKKKKDGGGGDGGGDSGGDGGGGSAPQGKKLCKKKPPTIGVGVSLEAQAVDTTAWDSGAYGVTAMAQVDGHNGGVGVQVLQRVILFASMGVPCLSKIDAEDQAPPFEQHTAFITEVLMERCKYTLQEVEEMPRGVFWALMWTMAGRNGLGDVVEQLTLEKTRQFFQMGTNAWHFIETTGDADAAFWWSALGVQVPDDYPKTQALIQQQDAAAAKKWVDVILMAVQCIREALITKHGDATAIDNAFGHFGPEDPLSFANVEAGRFMSLLFIAQTLGLTTDTQLATIKENLMGPVMQNIKSASEATTLATFMDSGLGSVQWSAVMHKTPAHVVEAIRNWVSCNILGRLDPRSSIIAQMTRQAFGLTREALSWEFMRPDDDAEYDQRAEQSAIYCLLMKDRKIPVPPRQIKSVELKFRQVQEQSREGPANPTKLFQAFLRIAMGRPVMVASDVAPTNEEDVKDSKPEPKFAAMQHEDGSYCPVPYSVAQHTADGMGLDYDIIHVADPRGFVLFLEDWLGATLHADMECDRVLFKFSCTNAKLAAASIFNAFSMWQLECMNCAVGRKILTPDDARSELWFQFYGAVLPYINQALKTCMNPIPQLTEDEIEALFVYKDDACKLSRDDAFTHFKAILNPDAPAADILKGMAEILKNGGMPCDAKQNMRLAFIVCQNAQRAIAGLQRSSITPHKELDKMFAVFAVFHVLVNGGPAQQHGSFGKGERVKALHRLVDAFEGSEDALVVDLPARQRAQMTVQQIVKMAGKIWPT